MPYYYYGFDWTYLVIVLPCLILSMLASSSVNSTFNKYAKVNSIRRLTGAEAAQRVLSANGVRGVRIERVSGNLTDHYDPKQSVLRPMKRAMPCSMLKIMAPSKSGLPSFPLPI